MNGIVHTILRNKIYRKREKVLRNRLFGYSTAYNNSEGAILSWIAPYGYPQTNQGERLRNAKSVFSMPLPLINPFPRGYMLVSKISETLKLRVSASLVGLPFVSGYPTFLFAQVVWAVPFIRLYESNAVKNKKALLSCRVVRCSLITTYVIQCDLFNI